ncbi:hypothetical protein D3C81_315010 [compost metagenome]
MMPIALEARFKELCATDVTQRTLPSVQIACVENEIKGNDCNEYRSYSLGITKSSGNDSQCECRERDFHIDSPYHFRL